MENWLTSSFNRNLLVIALAGIILIGFGVLYFKSGGGFSPAKVEVLTGNVASESGQTITTEIAGEVIAPGVYKLSAGARVEDLLVKGGGLTASADRDWTDKYLNRAAKLTDGQKVYIPKVGEQTLGESAKNNRVYQSGSLQNSSDSNKQINVNSASLTELDSLPGIGQVYGQKIIDHRPYSKVEELLSKNVLKPSVYNKIKDLVTVY
jgi:competence protein ComEA